MENTWLIQRLKAPRVPRGKLDALAQTFCFGGGGGFLSKKAWELLSPIFHFDYMGAAEYEFGAVPKALSAMVDRTNAKTLIAFEVKIPRKKIAVHREDRIPIFFPYGEKKPKNPKPVPELTEDPIVYVIGNKDDKDEIIDRLKLLAQSKMRLKEPANFARALDPIEYLDKGISGWLELDNGFFFTIDKTMFEGMKGLFQLNDDSRMASTRKSKAA